MLRLLVALLLGLRSAWRSRRDLVSENSALRLQLATLAQRRRPDLRPLDRAFWGPDPLPLERLVRGPHPCAGSSSRSSTITIGTERPSPSHRLATGLPTRSRWTPRRSIAERRAPRRAGVHVHEMSG
jgi:hypothetical protein